LKENFSYIRYLHMFAYICCIQRHKRLIVENFSCSDCWKRYTQLTKYIFKTFIAGYIYIYNFYMYIKSYYIVTDVIF